MGGTKINWLEWNNESFSRAKKEDRPILLDISAVWCYWCHRMEQDTYSDDEVAKIIHEKYVPIKVDNDKRPDVNARYNMGGWPTTAILTPDGETIAGATYIPPEQMKHFLEAVHATYKQDKNEIHSRLGQISRKESLMSIAEVQGVALNAEVFENVVAEIVLNYDDQYGGFGIEPKFPNVEALRLLLLKYRKSKDSRYLNMATKTLSAMYNSEMYDKVENGFFRYAVHRNWSEPHYEKMLDDHAELLRVYCEAFQVTKEEIFRKAAEGIVNYLKTHLETPEGGFYGSQDADEEYYKLDSAGRKTKKAPFIDKTIYVNWNGKMISSYLYAYSALGDSHLKDFALKSIDFILRHCYEHNKELCHYYSNGQKGISGLLVDNLYFANALLDAYEVTAESRYLGLPQEIADYMIAKFFDNEKSGFKDIATGEALGKLKTAERSFVENAHTARFLTKLHYITGKEEYHKKAETVLKLLQTTHDYYGIFAAAFSQSLDFYLNHAMVNLVYSKADEKSKLLHTEILKTYYPNKIVRALDVNEDKAQIEKLGYSTQSFPMAFICFGTMCMPPAMNAEKVQAIFERK
ncbi:TPA: thioredoxin domain-containing protein [archaeon]|nr:thioredoxin domain-containing protein [Candidatus Naiadarchaeales archaeon SRR2090159.bin1288]